MTQTSARDTGLTISDPAWRMQVSPTAGKRCLLNEYRDERIQNETCSIRSDQNGRDGDTVRVYVLE